MALFLFLSGYGLNESFKKKRLDGFWKNKLLRVVVPYALWMVMLFLIVQVLPQYTFFWKYWYFEYLFLWYALFWLSRKFFPNNALWLMFIMTVLLFPFLRNIKAEQSLSFVMGVAASENMVRLQNVKKQKWMVWCAILLVSGLSLLCFKQLPVVRAFGEESNVVKLIQLGIKLPLGLSVAIFTSLLYRNNLFWKVFGIIGTISLELYLVQMPLMGGVNGNIFNLLRLIVLISVLSFVLHKTNKYFIMLLRHLGIG